MNEFDQTDPAEQRARVMAAMIPGARVCFAMVIDPALQGRAGTISRIDSSAGTADVVVSVCGTEVIYTADLINLRPVNAALYALPLETAALTLLTGRDRLSEPVRREALENGSIDAARLDITPPMLWAFGVRVLAVPTEITDSADAGDGPRSLLVLRDDYGVFVDLQRDAGEWVVVALSAPMDLHEVSATLGARLEEERLRIDAWLTEASDKVRSIRAQLWCPW